MTCWWPIREDGLVSCLLPKAMVLGGVISGYAMSPSRRTNQRCRALPWSFVGTAVQQTTNGTDTAAVIEPLRHTGHLLWPRACKTFWLYCPACESTIPHACQPWAGEEDLAAQVHIYLPDAGHPAHGLVRVIVKDSLDNFTGPTTRTWLDSGEQLEGIT